MFQWLGKVLGSSKVIDAAIRTGDALVETDEEHKSWMLDYIKITGNIARRFIALIVVAVWAIAVILMFIFNQMFPDWYIEAKKIMDDNINDPFLVVLGFYFLKHAVSAGATPFARSTK